jgi:hypothetical protein
LLLLTTAAAAFGVFLGLPMKKASAATQDWKMAPAPTVNQPAARLEVIQPRYVNPTAVTLLRIADQALSDNALAERISRDPDGVAAQFHLSNNERLVLRHMTFQQFQTARTDAARVVATRMSYARSMAMPAGATDPRRITEGMIVGRAILAAAGRSYLNASNANACCPWSKAIELGINSDPAYYNAVFARPAGVLLPQSGMSRPQ